MKISDCSDFWLKEAVSVIDFLTSLGFSEETSGPQCILTCLVMKVTNRSMITRFTVALSH